MLTHSLIDALYFAALLPALFFGSARILVGVVIVLTVMLALSILVFLRSGREVEAGSG